MIKEHIFPMTMHLVWKMFSLWVSSPSLHTLPINLLTIKKGEIVEASFMMMKQEILKMPKAEVIDSRLQDQASRIQSKIQDSREEIKKQQVKTSYRISIKRIFQKPNSTVLFYKRIFSNFLSYQSDYSLAIDYQWPVWFSNDL